MVAFYHFNGSVHQNMHKNSFVFKKNGPEKERAYLGIMALELTHCD